VNEHGIDAYCFEEDDILQKPVNDLILLHRRAAIFDDESLPAKSLNVRKRLDEALSSRFRSHGHSHVIRRG
jgi:hypothetical protein